MRPLVIDNFAGGGGASTGIEAAIGRPVDIAINHDPEAVAMHAANHPATRHFCQSIMAVDPLEATGGAPVALAWFSPDCKHHSKAKGGRPREKNIRDLAWVVVHWAERLRKATPDGRGAPAVIMLENVEEFRQWGPLDAAGKPIPERRGEEFDLWVRGLKRQGYKVEWRELRACDYGAPTSRKRLFLIARRDGRPIVWPVPTHAKRGSPEVAAGTRLAWRTAAECIDWSIPCPSIFDRKRPLKEATHRRIAHGVMRYVVNAARPFIVRAAHGDDGRHRTHPIDAPIGTQPATNEFAVVDAAIVPITHSGDLRVHPSDEPLRTVTTANGGELARVAVTIASLSAGRPESTGQEPGSTAAARPKVENPLARRVPSGINVAGPGIAPAGCDGPAETLLAPHVTKFHSGSVGSAADAPMPTVTSNGDAARPAGATPLGEAAALLTPFYGEKRDGSVRASNPADEPLRTQTCDPRFGLVQVGLVEKFSENSRGTAADVPLDTVMAAALLTPFYGEKRDGSVRASNPADEPLRTQTCDPRFGLVQVGLVEKFSENSRGTAADVPLDTVMAGAPRHAAVTAFLSHFYTSNTNGGQGDPDRPAKTVTSEGQHHAIVCAHMEQANTGRVGHDARAPVSTITSQGSHQRVVETTLIEAGALPPALMARAVEVAAFLIKYYGSGDSQAQPADRPLDTVTTLARFAVVTVTIDATTYVIVDVGMRMLARRELANAQDFPPGYVLDPIGPNGKPLTISASIRMIGNSVCPAMSEALVRANLPELCATAEDGRVAA